jgi:hypothetical protein
MSLPCLSVPCLWTRMFSVHTHLVLYDVQRCTSKSLFHHGHKWSLILYNHALFSFLIDLIMLILTVCTKVHSLYVKKKLTLCVCVVFRIRATPSSTSRAWRWACLPHTSSTAAGPRLTQPRTLRLSLLYSTSSPSPPPPPPSLLPSQSTVRVTRRCFVAIIIIVIMMVMIIKFILTFLSHGKRYP